MDGWRVGWEEEGEGSGRAGPGRSRFIISWSMIIV